MTIWTEEFANQLAKKYAHEKGALLAILHDVQDELGHIPTQGVDFLADYLNLTRAEVDGVVSFYHDFSTRKKGRHIVKICRAEACQAAGVEGLVSYFENKISQCNQSTADEGELFSLETVYCLGNCALSPSIMIDEKLYGRVDESRFDYILKSWGDAS